MNRMKKLISILVCIAMLISFPNAIAFADDEADEITDFSDYILKTSVPSLSILKDTARLWDLDLDGDYILTFNYTQGGAANQDWSNIAVHAGGNIFKIFPKKFSGRVFEVSYNDVVYSISGTAWSDRSAVRTSAGSGGSASNDNHTICDRALDTSAWYQNDNTTVYNVYISKIGGVMTFGIKKSTEEAYHWLITKYVSPLEKNDIAIRNQSMGSTVSMTDFKVYTGKARVIAKIDGEQPAKAGAEIFIRLEFEEGGPEDCPITAKLEDSVTSLSVGGLECPACEEDGAIKLVLPEDLDFSTEYEIDISDVKAAYTLNDIQYTDALYENKVTFKTNNGEKEKALDAVNKASNETEMCAALADFNAFENVDERIDFFTDDYFTRAEGDADQLLTRKNQFARKLIEYREKNGSFTKMDFSDLCAAADEATLQLKLQSYLDAAGAANEDILGIFFDTQYYDSDAKKTEAAALICELAGGKAPETVDALTNMEHKARSVMAASAAENEMLTLVFDDTEQYDFDGVIDLKNEDYASNKEAVVKKMTALRPVDFRSYTVEGLKKDFELSVALAAVNAAKTRLDAADAIQKYAKALDLNLTGYEKYDANLVCIALVERDFKSAAEIQTAIDDRVAELNAKAEKEQSSGSGRSGGGGGGSITIAPAVSTVTPQPEQSAAPSAPPAQETEEVFRDLDSAVWAKDAILCLYKEGKVKGVGGGAFEPNRSITRAEFSKLLTDIFDLKADPGISFSDVGESDWYYGCVSAVAAAGIVYGNEKHEFMPNEGLTRQDMAVMIYRLLMSRNSGSVLSDEGNAENFNDFWNISDYAKEAVGKLSASGIVNGMGDGSFAPLKQTTRAEAAVLLCRVRSSLGGEKYE